MKYSVDYIPDKKVVSVNINGRLNYKFAEQYSKEAVKLAHVNDCEKFLFNHSDTILNGDEINLHATGDELQQFGFKNTDRIAIIIGKVGKKKDLFKFENLNSSWCIFKYFDENKIQDAFDWLQNDS